MCFPDPTHESVVERVDLDVSPEFGSLTEARVVTEDWRNEYNTWRPHSSLTPAEHSYCRHTNMHALPRSRIARPTSLRSLPEDRSNIE